MMTILIRNGPNLNSLGMREPRINGPQTQDEVEHMRFEASSEGNDVSLKQSNHEGQIIASDPLVQHAERFGWVIRSEEARVASDRDGLSAITVIEAIKTLSAIGQTVEVRV